MDVKDFSFKIMHVIDIDNRLDELKEVPRTPDGNIDYWLASKLLCEKDGGRLPTEEELAELASYIYEIKIEPRRHYWKLKIRNTIPELEEYIPGYFWSSSELSASVAVIRNIYSNTSSWSQGYRNHRHVPLCVGDKKDIKQGIPIEFKEKDNSITDGVKYDTGKPLVGTLCRIFPNALLEVGKCIEFGTHKYPEEDNWQRVDNAFNRYQNAMIRHLLKHNIGKEEDDETGLYHLSHMAWNALAVLELYIRSKDESRNN